MLGAALALANFFIEGGKTFSLAVLAAYPTAVIGAGVGSVAQLLWRKIIGRRSPRPQPTFARVTKRAKWAAIGFGFAGLLMGFGWLYRPYSAGWIEISGAAVNSFPYGLFFSFMGGALAALVCWARPERPRLAQPA
ncbi:MAG: hypothetical protein N2512_00950 [Armatimonadetes bacterium]|nr:hypothetical protein [Armatimonadota bacterium]